MTCPTQAESLPIFKNLLKTHLLFDPLTLALSIIILFFKKRTLALSIIIIFFKKRTLALSIIILFFKNEL